MIAAGRFIRDLHRDPLVASGERDAVERAAASVERLQPLADVVEDRIDEPRKRR
jgi:hypothetical protein